MWSFEDSGKPQRKLGRYAKKKMREKLKNPPNPIITISDLRELVICKK